MIYFVLLISLVLRLMSINQSLWLDEATTALVAQMNLTDFFGKFMLADFHPPLYYLIIHYWTYIFGTSEVVLRLPSVIFGILTVYLVYLVARETKQKWPIVPALFLATSGLHVYYSQEARMYSLATVLVCWLVYVYLKKKWIIFSLILPLIFLTDYVSIIILPALFIYSFFFSKGDIKKFLYSLGPLAISFLIWLPTFYNQISNGLAVKENASSWWNILGPVTFKNIALIPIKFIIGRVSIDDKTVYAAVVLILLSIFGYLISKAKNNLVWTWFVASLLLGICVSFFIPTLTYFRYLFILPAFYLLLSEGASKIFTTKWQTLSVVVVVAVNIMFTGSYLLNSKFQRENWREVAKQIGNETVVLPANSQKEALVYYDKGEQIVTKENISKSGNTIWLSRYVWNIFDPSDSTRKKLDDLGYNWSEEINLNGVVFWKYTKQ